MIKLKLGEWQKRAVTSLSRRLLRRDRRSALLQLPTGFGKSLVACRVYERLKRRVPALRLVIVLPKRGVPEGWKDALGLEGDVQQFTWLDTQPKVRFETRRTLSRAFLSNGGGHPSALAKTLHRWPTLVVIDEIHRHRRLLDALSSTFADRDKVGEGQLTTPFRRPAKGQRTWPKWLLLSATPFNPVRLDRVDPPDTSKTSNTFESADLDDEAVLADEVERTLGALAYLDGHVRAPWFDEHVGRVRSRLAARDGAEPLGPPRELLVVPPAVRHDDFRPSRKRRFDLIPQEADKERDARAVRELVAVQGAFDAMEAEDIRRATGERLVLSGGPLEVAGQSIQGQPYGLSLSRTVGRGAAALREQLGDPETSYPAKVKALVEFLRAVEEQGPQNVLVFCVHRAVAAGVTSVLGKEFGQAAPRDFVRSGIGRLDDSDMGWFSRLSKAAGGRMRILVCTDACSESRDLHQVANVLVHYELPWSPLRVMQRVGRLWRIRRSEARKLGGKPRPPVLPGIAHFAHPGSTDEEILCRLRRRWGHLGTLGLDYLSYEEALGMRLPSVSWEVGKADRGSHEMSAIARGSRRR